MIKHNVMINGIEVTASYTERAVNKVFLPLLERLQEIQKQKGRRILVMLAAPPGAGKSTLLSFLEQLWKKEKRMVCFQTIGMDGFHRRQEYLTSHFVQWGEKQIPMVQIKGAPVTFDLDRLAESVKRVAEGEVCGWPIYDRMLHNPVENAVKVEGDIVLLEGNYLLLDTDGWRELTRYADYTISISADESLLRKRLIERRMKTGVDEEEAVRFVDFSDMPNARLCLQKTKHADLMMHLDMNGDYHATDIADEKQE